MNDSKGETQTAEDKEDVQPKKWFISRSLENCKKLVNSIFKSDSGGVGHSEMESTSTSSEKDTKETPDDDRRTVTMPYVCQENGSTSCEFGERWQLIKEALTDWQLSDDRNTLQDAILKYNQELSRWKFDTLFNFSVNQKQVFQRVTPRIIELALSLPELVPDPVPLLAQGVEGEVSFRQDQLAAILANAFLCTFPRREHILPSINFDRMFQEDNRRKQEKLKCIYNYFDLVAKRCSKNTVTFKRLVLSDEKKPAFWESTKKLCNLDVKSTGSIEETGDHALQVDFANKFIGGGVLKSGLVQEEIRMMTNPELIVARLFTEELKDNEALLMIGSKCYNKFSGYSDSFRFEGNYSEPPTQEEETKTPEVDKIKPDVATGEPETDPISPDECKKKPEVERSLVVPEGGDSNRKCVIVAIDATHFRRSEFGRQFDPSAVLRETNKAYVGFLAGGLYPGAPVATGNWGCGAFNGDPRLKALVQIMAATEAGRPLIYYTYGDQNLEQDIREIHAMLVEKGVTVGDLLRKITAYKFSRSQSLYDMLIDRFNLPKKTEIPQNFGKASRTANKDVQTWDSPRAGKDVLAKRGQFGEEVEGVDSPILKKKEKLEGKGTVNESVGIRNTKTSTQESGELDMDELVGNDMVKLFENVREIENEEIEERRTHGNEENSKSQRTIEDGNVNTGINESEEISATLENVKKENSESKIYGNEENAEKRQNGIEDIAEKLGNEIEENGEKIINDSEGIVRIGSNENGENSTTEVNDKEDN